MVLRYSSFWNVWRRRLELINDCVIHGRVVLACRASPTKNRKSDLQHLRRQVADARQMAMKLGLNVVGVIAKRCMGSNPAWLKTVSALAKSLGPDVQILAQRPSRILRPDDFDPHHNRYAKPTAEQLRQLSQALDGVRVVTLMRPDASEDEESSVRSRYGQRQTGRKGGGDRIAGHKKRRRDKWRPCVQALYQKTRGMRSFTMPEIVALTGLPRATVYRWAMEEAAAES